MAGRGGGRADAAPRCATERCKPAPRLHPLTASRRQGPCGYYGEPPRKAAPPFAAPALPSEAPRPWAAGQVPQQQDTLPYYPLGDTAQPHRPAACADEGGPSPAVLAAQQPPRRPPSNPNHRGGGKSPPPGCRIPGCKPATWTAYNQRSRRVRRRGCGRD